MTRQQFVDKVIALIESAPEPMAREIGEALVGMGVGLLEQIGVDRRDVAQSIIQEDRTS